MGTLVRLGLLGHGFFLWRRRWLGCGLAWLRLVWRSLVSRWLGCLRLGCTRWRLRNLVRNPQRLRNRFLLRCRLDDRAARRFDPRQFNRSEEHTSELQSQSNILCRLL